MTCVSVYGTYRVEKLRVENGYFVFDYQSPNGRIENLKFNLPGRHNAENAAVAIAVAQHLGVSDTAIQEALASFKGIKRRFDIIYRDGKRVYIDDYAHHPSELNAAIEAAKTLFPDRKITGIFQPHLYSRTRDFVDGFAAALDQLDDVILLDIYPARELPIPGITSQVILDKMENSNKALAERAQLLSMVSEKQPAVLLTMGAGDIDRFVEPLKALMTHG